MVGKKYFLSSLVIGLVLVTAGWAITNGDFESGDLSYWTDWGTGVASVVFGTSHTGDYSAQLFVGGLGQVGDIGQTESAANIGDTWRVEGWAYKTGGTCKFGWYDGPEVTVNAGSWTKYTDTITFTTGDYKDVDFNLSGTIGSSAYLDDVETFKVSTPDTTPPTWSYSTGVVSVTNPVPGQILVIWSIATDAQSPPVKYNLYRNTTTNATDGTKFANVTSPYTMSGLAGGKRYYFTVRAEDSAILPNETTNQDNKSILLPTGVTHFLWELYQ